MQHTFFEIKNYRGIGSVKLDLTSKPKAPVFTLVGLNESGKTTVLEAIHSFSQKADFNPLNVPGYSTRDVHELIPISQRSNFNGEISISAGFACDAEDRRAITNFAQSELGCAITDIGATFSVRQSWQFKDSKATSVQPRQTWDIKITARRKGERRAHPLAAATDEWKKIIAHIRELLPSILYFPNFLFELPDRILLEAGAGADEGKHAFYRGVIQDILDAIGEQTTLEQHILQRAKSGTSPDRRSMESVLLKMGSHISQTVFTSWNKIFKRVSGGKEIQVSIDQDEAGSWYLQLRLKDGSNLYEISERSLGFRWFFAFLLLTQYRGYRKGGSRGALFLFDEPASNLHPSAQGQLLESFGRFPDHAPIVYTTHSHHMVNPDWLEGTYVVKNEAIDYDADEDDYSARKTIVTLHKYRTFAASHPNQSTYFQPVLDVLAYQPARLENVPEVVMIEGKSDYFTIRYMQWYLGESTPQYLLPGTGAGSLSDPIRLYSAWGRDFVVLLDADKEGRKQKQRYQELFESVVDGALLTLEDIDLAWHGKGSELLFEEEDRIAIQRARYPEEKFYNKALFNRAIQELIMVRERPALSKATTDRFQSLFRDLSKRLAARSAGSAGSAGSARGDA